MSKVKQPQPQLKIISSNIKPEDMKSEIDFDSDDDDDDDDYSFRLEDALEFIMVRLEHLRQWVFVLSGIVAILFSIVVPLAVMVGYSLIQYWLKTKGI